jgi:hypothetical protein
MEAYTGPRPALAADQGDVDVGPGGQGRRKSPDAGRRRMADHGPLPAECQERRDLARHRRERLVADEVHATMDPVKGPVVRAPLDRAPVEAELEELRARDCPSLRAGEACDPLIQAVFRVDFVPSGVRGSTGGTFATLGEAFVPGGVRNSSRGTFSMVWSGHCRTRSRTTTQTHPRSPTLLQSLDAVGTRRYRASGSGPGNPA